MSRVILEGKPPSEIVNEVFNFTSRLAVSETIGSASTVATVYSGTDSAPSDILYGNPTVSGAQVTQRVGGGTLGVVYQLVCTAVTSTGQQLKLTAFLPIVPESF